MFLLQNIKGCQIILYGKTKNKVQLTPISAFFKTVLMQSNTFWCKILKFELLTSNP